MISKCLGIFALNVAVSCSIYGQSPAPPVMLWPPDGVVLTQSVPHFEWQRPQPLDPEFMPACEIQIVADERGAKVVDQDRIAGVIGWYVPDRELAPGDYW